MAKFPRPEDGMRAIAARAPQAEALAASWIERWRPHFMQIYMLRRKIATITVGVLAALLFVHVMFGANGMVVYRQKRNEYQALKKQIDQLQKENDRYSQQVQALQSDRTAIEKEARETMGYAKPGEYVYVPNSQARPANHMAKK